MKTFKQLIVEVAQPNNEDELNFIDKHYVDLISAPPANDKSVYATYKKSPKRPADYEAGEDEEVYEAKLDPVGQEDDDIDNDGDVDSSDEYLRNRRKVISKAMKKEATQSPYAIGMASAMKQAGDKPPLKKSTITKAHKIAKSIMKSESLDEDATLDKIRAILTKRNDGTKVVKDKSGYFHIKYTDSHKGPYHTLQDVLRGLDESTFVAKAAAAHKDGKKKFTLGDKTFPVTIKKSTADKIALESAQLDEVSKDKLKSYMDAARKDMRNRYYDDSPESDKKFSNRSKGIEKALDKRDANSKAKVPATESFDMDEALAAHIVRGDSYAGVPDGIVMKAKEQVKKMKLDTATAHEKAMYKALADLGWEKTIAGKWVRESFELAENFKAGAVKLNDGSSVVLKDQDAKLLNQMFDDLNADNKKRMMKVAMADKNGFNEILSFAREAL